MNSRRVEQEIARLTNRARGRRRRLSRDRECVGEARDNVRWMIRRNLLVHRAQFECDDTSPYAENISYLPRDVARSPRQAASYVVKHWMGSPGHRRNILNPQFGMTGIAARVDRRGGLWISQTFAEGEDWGNGRNSFWRWLLG